MVFAKQVKDTMPKTLCTFIVEQGAEFLEDLLILNQMVPYRPKGFYFY